MTCGLCDQVHALQFIQKADHLAAVELTPEQGFVVLTTETYGRLFQQAHAFHGAAVTKTIQRQGILIPSLTVDRRAVLNPLPGDIIVNTRLGVE